MKSLVLGLIVMSTSVSFAQTNGASHQLKNKFTAKQQMAVLPEASNVNGQAAATGMDARSRVGVKSSFVDGVVRVENGEAYIHLLLNRADRRLVPVNIAQEQLKKLKTIRFRYEVVEEKVSGGRMSVRLYDMQEVIQR